MQVLVALSFLCVWNLMPKRNLQTVVLPVDFSHLLLVGICDFVERFHQKPFSTSDQIRLRRSL